MPPRNPADIQRIRREMQQGQAPPLTPPNGPKAPRGFKPPPVSQGRGPNPAAPPPPPGPKIAFHGAAARPGQPGKPPPAAPAGKGALGGVQLVRDPLTGNITPKWIGAPNVPSAAGSARLLKGAEPQMFRREMPTAQPQPAPPTAAEQDQAQRAALEAQGGQAFGLPPGEGLEGLDWSTPENFAKSVQTIHPTWRGTLGAFLGNPIVSAVTSGFGAAMGAGFVASMVAGPEVFLPVAALVAIPATAYALWKGSEAFNESPIGKALGWLDWARSGVERVAGTTAQIGAAALATAMPEAVSPKDVGTLPEVLGHLKETWQAAQMTYAVMSPHGLTNIFDPSQWGTAGHTFVDYDLPDAPGGLQALVEARRRIGGWNGAPPEDPQLVIADIQSRYGVGAMVRQLGSGFVADPLMALGWLSTKGLGMAGRAIGNEDLAMVADRMLTPRRVSNMLPGWVTSSGAHVGIGPTVQAYRNFLVSEKVFRAGFTAGADLSRLERFIIGEKTLHLLETGKWTPPTWSKLNPLSWITYNLSETPESAAREAVYQFSNNAQAYLSSLDWTDPATPERAVNLIRAWKAAGMATEMPEVFPEGGHIPYTIEGRIYSRVLPAEAADELLATYQQTRDMAQGLQAMADALGVKPKAVLDRMGDPEGLTALMAELRASGAPGMDLVTPQALDALYKVFATDGVPLDGHMFHAALVEKMMEQAGYWAVSTYGVHATGVITRFAAAVKAAESAALLGLNITYPVRNALNNEVMLAVAGAWGIRDIKSILGEMDRAGLSPARMEQGFAGAADIDVAVDADFQHWGKSAVGQAMQPITAATRAGGRLEQFRDYVSHFTSKLPGTRAAQWAERTQSARAYYQGFMEWWGQTWTRRGAIPKLPPDLEAELSRLDPRLPNAVLAAAEGGMNLGELRAAILEQAPVLSTKRVISDVATRLGVSESDVNRLLAVDGLGEWLDERLKALGPDARPEQINPIFAEARDRAEHALNVLAAQDVAVAAEHAAAKVTAEGPTAVLDLFGNVEQALYETYSAHSHALSIEWDEIGRANPAIRDVLIGRMKDRSEQTWARYFAYEHAVYDGIAKGIESTGYKDFTAAEFMKVIDAKRAEVAQFQTVKNQIRDRFFATKFRNAAIRDAAWAEVQTREVAIYNRLITRLEKKQAKLDGYLVAWAKYHAGEEYAARVQAWRSYTANANFGDMRDVAAFRQSLLTLDRAGRNAAWLTFQNQRLRARYLIAQQGLDMLHGLGAPPQVARAPLPVGGELKPGTWWQDVAERYGLNYVRKDGTPHWQHFVRAVNKYLPEPIIGPKIRLSQAEINGVPAPDRLGMIIDALEARRAEKGGAAPTPPRGPTPPPAEPAGAPAPAPETPLTGGPGFGNVIPPPGLEPIPPDIPSGIFTPVPTRPASAAELPNGANIAWHDTRAIGQVLNELGWSDEQIARMPAATAAGYVAARTTPAMAAAAVQAPEARLRGVRVERPAQPPVPEAPPPEVPTAAAQAPEAPPAVETPPAVREPTPEMPPGVPPPVEQTYPPPGQVTPPTAAELAATADQLAAARRELAARQNGIGTNGGHPGNVVPPELIPRYQFQGGETVAWKRGPDQFTGHVLPVKGAFPDAIMVEDGRGNVIAVPNWDVVAIKTNAAIDNLPLRPELPTPEKGPAAPTAEKPAAAPTAPEKPAEIPTTEKGVATAPTAEQPPAAPTLPEGTRVQWTARNGEQLTGTIRGMGPDYGGFYHVDTDQILAPGGVPLGRIERVHATRLQPLEAAPEPFPTAPVHGPGNFKPGQTVYVDGQPATIIQYNHPTDQWLVENANGEKYLRWSESLSPTPPDAAPDLPPPVRPDIQEARNATAEYMEMQQAAADLVEPPTHLFNETQYIIPGLPDDLLPGPLADGRNLWDLTLDERLALEKTYVQAYQKAMGRPVDAAFTPEMVKRVIEDHWNVALRANELPIERLHGGFNTGDQVDYKILTTQKKGPAKIVTRKGIAWADHSPVDPDDPAKIWIQDVVSGRRHTVPLADVTLVKRDITNEYLLKGTQIVPEAVWESFDQAPDDLIAKYADPHAIPGQKIGRSLGRNGKKSTTPPAVKGGRIKAGGPNVPAAATPAAGENLPGQPGQPGPADIGPLEGTPPEDVRGLGAAGETPLAGVPDTGEGGGRPGVPNQPEGAGLQPGRGVGAGPVATPGRGGRATTPVRPTSLSRPGGGGGVDYLITDADQIGAGGPKTKFQQNIDAIQTLKQIEADGRMATPAEQQVLVKYTGWGALKEEAFGYYGRHADFDALRDQLRELLTDEEWTAARSSTLNAHYSAMGIIDAMWRAARRLGFDGGRVSEPAVGVGHFLGRMPADLAVRSARVGVELDSLTARIAKQLYQNADIFQMGFQETKFPKNYFDLHISNVPFGDYGVFDKEFLRGRRFLSSRIHDYFFAKSLDYTRPGGLIAFITSAGTMDKLDSRVRAYLASQADLVGAIRLPNTAFKANAGTEVTTDILFLTKRAPGQAPAGESWLESRPYGPPNADGVQLNVNEYFQAHPEMMLGKMELAGTMYREGTPTLTPLPGHDLLTDLNAAVERLPEGVYGKAQITPELPEPIPALGAKERSYQVREGQVYVVKAAKLEPQDLTDEAIARVSGLVEVRDTEIALHEAQRLGHAEDMARLRADLNRQYDAFVAKHGPLHSPENIRALKGDPDLGGILGLEEYNPDTGEAGKRIIFRENTSRPSVPITHANNAQEALTASLNQYGRLDIDHMADLLGETPEQVGAQMVEAGIGYHNPEGNWEPADMYLSGNVRAKLAAARMAAKLDPAYAPNVAALEAVQPLDIPPDKIVAKMGASWIDTPTYEDFIQHLLPSQRYSYRGGQKAVEVTFIEASATWRIKADEGIKNSVGNQSQWATNRRTALDLIQDLMHQKATVVNDRLPDGGQVLNEIETNAARAMQEKIAAEFATWLWADPDQAAHVAGLYNNRFNANRLRLFDGSHLTLPGTAAEFAQGAGRALRPNQLDGAWRIISSGQNTLLAHAVGAGKTYTMIAAGMELKRLGLARKPMYVVPNHLVEQWAGDFARMYPDSRVLITSTEDFTAAARGELLAKIANDDWDAVIVSQKNFERVPVSLDTWDRFAYDQLEELRDAIRAAHEANGGNGRRSNDAMVRILESAANRLEDKLLRLRERVAKEQGSITFEQLGVDRIFVDEAQAYKNLYYYTRMQKVKGLGDAEGSGRALDMFIKTQYLSKRNNGQGVVFATGTPISNSLVETYTMQRFMQFDRMRELGISSLDSWVANFANARTTMGLSVDGQRYKPMTILDEFINAPEVVAMFRDYADVKTAEELHLPIPETLTGKPIPVEIEASPELKAFVQTLVQRAEDFEAHPRPHSPEMLLIATDGRKAALDMRLIDPKLPDNPLFKVNQAAAKIYDIWKETTADRSTQLVFCDLSAPKKGKQFSVYDDLRAKLVKKGIPKNEIAFMQDYKSDEAKQQLFMDVNNGKVRVLIGSTETMGAGTNVQRRLIAEHHLDAPWRPGDLEQRDGRILRPENNNPVVRIYRYIAQDGFDAFMWDKIATKAKIITAVMKGSLTERTLSMPDAVVMSAQEMIATASGNPMIRQKFEVDAEVSRLRVLEQAHYDQQFRLENDARAYQGRINTRQQMMDRMQATYQRYQASHPEAPALTIGKDTYAGAENEDPHNLAAGGQRLVDLFQKAQGSTAYNKGVQRQVIGSVNGFELGIEAQYDKLAYFIKVDGKDQAVFSHRGNVTYYLVDKANGLRMDFEPTGTGAGTADHALKTLRGLPDQIEANRKFNVMDESSIATLKAEQGKPFPQAEKLAAAYARQAEIDAALNSNAKPPPGGDIVDLGDNGGPPSDLPPDTDPSGVGGGDTAQNAIYQLPGLGNFIIEGWDAKEGAYVVRRLDDNTVHVLARPKAEEATFVGPDQFDQAAGGAPLPRAQASQEAWYGRLLPLLDEIQKRLELEARYPAIRSAAEAGPEVRQGLEGWLRDVAGAQSEAKLGAMKWGEFRRDLAMLNYSRRYNIDTLLANFLPYEFWMTHSLAKWALHTLDRPSLLANYYRIAKFLNTAVTRPGFPTRLAGRVRIPIPWMPDWMGGAMYVDPLMIGLPLEQFALPFQQAADQQRNNESSAAYEIEQGMKDGTIPQAEGLSALATHTGPTWNQAMATVTTGAGAEQQQDILDFAQLMMSPHLPLTWALAYLRGKQNTVGPLPITRQLKAITALTGIGPAGGFNLEAGLRQALGLPIFDQWEDYRVDRTLADMAAEGVIDTKTAEAAMIDRSGPAFEMATHRAAVQSGFGTVTSFVFGTPGTIYPEGEHTQRDLSVLFRAARAAQDSGDTQAIARFFEAHPEYSARLALNATPAKRIQNFLVDDVWNAWNDLPDLYRRQVQAAFGPTFEQAFLSPETRSYESIPPETLATWARTLGQFVPASVAGSPLPIQWAPPQIAAQAQEFYDTRDTQFNYPAISALQKQYFAIPKSDRVALPVPAGVQNYLDTIAANYPGIQDLYDFYDNIGTSKGRSKFKKDHPIMGKYEDYRAWWRRQNPDLTKYLDGKDNYKGASQSARSAFAAQYPQLTQYWDWRRGWMAEHPEVQPYLDEINQMQNGATSTQTSAESEPTGIIAAPETQRVITAYLFAGAYLPADVKAKLNQVYLQQLPPAQPGKTPPTFNQWLLEIMAFGGNLEGPAAPEFNPPVAQPYTAP